MNNPPEFNMIELWSALAVIGVIVVSGGVSCGLIVLYVQKTSRDERARSDAEHDRERRALNNKIQELEDKVDILSAKVDQQNEIILKFMRSGYDKSSIVVNNTGDANIAGDIVGGSKS